MMQKTINTLTKTQAALLEALFNSLTSDKAVHAVKMECAAELNRRKAARRPQPKRPEMVPEVGECGFQPVGSDRYPIECVFVSHDKQTIEVRPLGYRATSPTHNTECQSYEFYVLPDAETDTYTLRRNGYYVRAGQPMKHGAVAIFGQGASAYRDPHF